MRLVYWRRFRRIHTKSGWGLKVIKMRMNRSFWVRNSGWCILEYLELFRPLKSSVEVRVFGVFLVGSVRHFVHIHIVIPIVKRRRNQAEK